MIVLEAKAEDKDPLIGKEQARKYAKGQNVNYIILSNGHQHYFWNIKRVTLNQLLSFLLKNHLLIRMFVPIKDNLLKEIDVDYIAIAQKSNYADNPEWKDVSKRNALCKHKLRFYALSDRCIEMVQNQLRMEMIGLFEMATDTGKTLTSSALIKMFLRSGNAKRVLF